jgi:hypothetical protein
MPYWRECHCLELEHQLLDDLTFERLILAVASTFKLRSWLKKLTSVPLGIYKEMPVDLDNGTEQCGDLMDRARKCMEDAEFYRKEEAKRPSIHRKQDCDANVMA